MSATTDATRALLVRQAADRIEALARELRDIHYPTYERLRDAADAAHRDARTLTAKENQS